MSHEKQKKEAQICRRWFISTHMYIGKCDFWVVTRKAEKRGPNLLPLINFHAHVYWKMWLLSCRTKSRKKRPKFAAVDLFPRACILENVTFELSHENQKKKPKFAAVDLFPRACIEKKFSKAVFTNFAATLAPRLNNCKGKKPISTISKTSSFHFATIGFWRETKIKQFV